MTLATPEQLNEDSANLVDLLIVLAKKKKWLIAVPLMAAIVAAAISFAMPNVYTATTKLLPPQQAQSGAAALLAQLGGGFGGGVGAAAGAAGLKNPNDLYIGILRSRTIADKLIARFDLKKVYDTESQEKARKLLEVNTAITSGKDGLISIEVDDLNQKKVADIANAYVDELVSLTRVFAVTEASQRRVFFERELETAKNNLANAEMLLKSSLESRGVISVDVESGAVLETVAKLKAQISAKEIQRNSMQAFVTRTHPDYQRVDEDLRSLREELSRLQNGSGNGDDDTLTGKNKSTTQAGLANIKVLRDVKYYQMLYELLAKQYEAARLDEAKDASIIQVLDRAVQPERKSSPKRALIVMLTTVITAFAVACWIIIVNQQRRQLRIPAKAAQWAQLRSYLRFGKSP